MEHQDSPLNRNSGSLDTIPYGTLDFYQLHFVMKCESKEIDRFLASCKPVTEGRLNNKRIVGVKWTGAGNFAEELQLDSELTELLKMILSFEGEIKVDPVENQIRIYGKWHNEYETRFDPTMLDIAERIATHVKTHLAGAKGQ